MVTTNGRVATCAEREWSADVSDAPLGLRFSGSLWLRWQLQNRGLLALTQRCQQHDPTIRKFQCDVMRAMPQGTPRLNFYFALQQRGRSAGQSAPDCHDVYPYFDAKATLAERPE